jgi:hypothetical protein
VVLEVDHIVPVSKGGGNDIYNLVTACFDCNRGKAAGSLTAVPQSLAERAALTAEREEQVKAFGKVMAKARKRIDDDAWRVASIWIQHFSEKGIRRDWFQSIKRFVEVLPVDICLDAMYAAIAKRSSKWEREHAFRYFCGFCWRQIKGPKQ